jgi:hypothetical protein
MQPLAGHTIGLLRIYLLARFARRRAHKASSQASELIKTTDECRADFEAPMHERQSQLPFCIASNPYYLVFKNAGNSFSKMLIKETDQSARWLNPLLLMALLRHAIGRL